MASVVGVHGNAGQANYSASKAGMIGLAKSPSVSGEYTIIPQSNDRSMIEVFVNGKKIYEIVKINKDSPLYKIPNLTDAKKRP